MTEQTGNNKPNEAEALAFPLSGNEKLIEEAAKAIHDVAMREYPGMPADIYGWDVQKDRDRDVYLLEARAALAVLPEPSTDDRDPITDENLWDFADDLLDAWNIEDANAPSLAEDFRDRFVARFHPAYRPEPQGEPSDAELLKLANDAHHRMVDEAESDGGWYGFSHSRDAWEDGFATGYRARAASSVTEQGEAEKPRCGGGRTHCRHDQWPPMHSMACPISKAAVTEQGENR